MGIVISTAGHTKFHNRLTSHSHNLPIIREAVPNKPSKDLIRMRKVLNHCALAVALSLMAGTYAAAAGPVLLAKTTLTTTSAGYYTDLSGLTNTLENGVSASLLGGMGSGLAWAGGNTFIAIPDRGPNAVEFNDLVDNTVSYIPRFHTVSMDLELSNGGALPFDADAYAYRHHAAL